MESFGPYRIEGELGRGPSGVVYRARDTGHDGRVVALKILDPRLSADPAFRARFHRDAAVLGAVREPHVVPVHGVGEIGGRLYVDMRLVRGTSLAARLAAGPLDEPRGRAIAGQIGSALESLGRGGLAPRPVAAQDVLLTGEPGRAEFVQLVGLGLGRPPVDPRSITPPDELVRHPAGWAQVPGAARRRRRWPVAVAAAVVLALVVTVVVALQGPGGPAGYLATIPAVGGAPLDVAATTLDGRPVVVTANADGSVGVWDPDTGEQAAAPIADARAVRALPVDLAGRASAAVVHADTTVTLHDLATGEAVGAPIGAVAPEIVRTNARFDVIRDATGGPVLLTGRADDDGFGYSYQGFDLPAGTPLGAAFLSGLGFDKALGTVVSGVPVVVQVDGDGTLYCRSLATGQVTGTPSAPGSLTVTALTPATRSDGTPLAATATEDGLVQVFDLRTGKHAFAPLVGHGRPPTGLLAARIDGRPVLVSTAADTVDPAVSETRFWDLDTGAAIGGPLRGHPLSQGVTGVGELGGRTVLFGLDDQRRATVWEASQLLRDVMQQ